GEGVEDVGAAAAVEQSEPVAGAGEVEGVDERAPRQVLEAGEGGAGGRASARIGEVPRVGLVGGDERVTAGAAGDGFDIGERAAAGGAESLFCLQVDQHRSGERREVQAVAAGAGVELALDALAIGEEESVVEVAAGQVLEAAEREPADVAGVVGGDV